MSSPFSLTLYIYPSPRGVDWRSPYHLTKSALINALTFRRRLIGHISVELRGPEEHALVGMSTLHFHENKKLLLLKGLGLGILYHQYHGFLETTEHLAAERDERLESGHFSFIQFLLSEASYLKVRRYLTEYQEQKKFLWYGLPNRPRYGEGAGCSAFAASFLEVAGIMHPEFIKNWSGSVRAPENLIGDQSKKVSIFKLIFPNKQNLRWAHADEPAREVFFWDPDKTHRWVQSVFEDGSVSKTFDFSYKKTLLRKTRGLVVDVQSIQPNNDPIWL